MSGMPPGWAETTLGEMCEPSRDSVTPSPEEPRPYLGLEHVEAHTTQILGVADASALKSTTLRFEAGDTLYGRLRPYLNKVCSPDFDGLASAEFMVFKRSEWLAPKFLMYFLNRDRFVGFASHVNEGDRPRVKWNQIAAYPVPLPPAAEQRRIVAAIEEHFSRLDAAEALLSRAELMLSRMRTAIAAHGTSGDWPTTRLGDVTESQMYGSSAKASGDQSGVPILRMGNIRDGRLDFSDLKYLPQGHPDIEKCRLRLGDLLFNRTNSPELVGKSAVFKTGPEPTVFASYLIRVWLRPDCDPDWAALAINSPAGRRYIASVRTQQVGQANVNGTKLAAMPIPLPPLEEQRRIVAEVERQLSLVDSLAAAVDAALKRSAALRRAILERAFTGRLAPQDPSDEPASVLLERIRAERAAAESATGRRPRRRATMKRS